MKIRIWVFFENTAKKIQASLKSDKNSGHYSWRVPNIYDCISFSFS